MGLEKVTEEILEKGKAEETRLMAEARTEGDRYIVEAQNAAKQVLSHAKSEAQERAKRLRVQELSISYVEVKKIRLNAEKEMLDKVHEETLNGLRGMSPEDSKRMLGAILSKVRLELGDQPGKAWSNQKEAATAKALCTEAGLQYGGTQECAGGLIVENLDGSIRYDYRYETLLEDIWNKKIKEVADILFG